MQALRGLMVAALVLLLSACGIAEKKLINEANQTAKDGVGGAFDYVKSQIKKATTDADITSDCGSQKPCIEVVADALFVEPRLTYLRTQYADIRARKTTLADAVAGTPLLEGETVFGPTALTLIRVSLTTGQYLQ